MSEFSIEWIRKHLPFVPDVILDIGTYDGADAVRLKAAYPKARVIAFEACPNNYNRIKEGGGVELAKVEVYHYAVSDENGERDFFSNSDARHSRSDDGCSGSILSPAPKVFERYPFLSFKDPKKTPTIRLDTFCEQQKIERIDVIHMDVQGAEGYVLRGLGALRPGIIFLETDATDEYVGTVALDSLRKWFDSNGYVLAWSGAHDSLYVQTNPLESLTVAITNFHRAKYLDRALTSAKAAGIMRVVVAAVEPDEEVEAVLSRHKGGWLSFDVARVRDDIGCNSTWMLAAYRCRTKRIIILHDDDLLCPEFKESFLKTIAPALNSGVGFASWRPNILYDNGRTTPCDYRNGPTEILPSSVLTPIIDDCLTHSPVISILDRETVIHACKESEQTLFENDSKERPGMLLGTELVVYLRHIEAFPKWIYVNKILSQFGSHPGSGTIANITSGKTNMLRTGYELAKKQGKKPKPSYLPKIIFSYSVDTTQNYREDQRYLLARKTWDFHFGQFSMIEIPISETDITRTTAQLQDPRPVPYVHDLFDIACSYAMPEDVVCYCNSDIGLTTIAPDRILDGVKKGSGITVCQRRLLYPNPDRYYRSVLNCKTDGGFDLMAFTPECWKSIKSTMPDMVIGREAWDTCFRVIAEGHSDHKTISRVSSELSKWLASNAYTDDVCWHTPHDSFWDMHRTTNPGQVHNRNLAREFFKSRGMEDLVAKMDAVRGPVGPTVKPHIVVKKPIQQAIIKPATSIPQNIEIIQITKPQQTYDILIVAQKQDIKFLHYCIKSIKRFTSGFNSVVVCVPVNEIHDFRHFRNDVTLTTFDSEKTTPQFELLRADEICQSDYIVHVDPTCLFWKTTTPINLFLEDRKCALMREPFTNQPMSEEVHVSRLFISNAIGIFPDFDTANRKPLIFPRTVYAYLRGLFEKHTNRSFSEICSMGAEEIPSYLLLGTVAHRFFKNEMEFINYDRSKDIDECGIIDGTTFKYIYRPERDCLVEGHASVGFSHYRDNWDRFIHGNLPKYYLK